jgi:uncharacterized cupredoxin-like copper-binding protein
MKYRFMLVIVPLVALLVLTGCAGVTSTSQGAQPTTPSQAQVAHITLSDSGISADRSTFSAGMSYHFVVTNTGQVAYQFMMGSGGWKGHHMPMGWGHQMTLYQSYQIAPGATQTFDYTFPASAVGQSFGFGCSRMGWQEGMWYPFTVQPQAP